MGAINIQLAAAGGDLPLPSRQMSVLEREPEMIGNAVQKGAWVYVYDERGRQIFFKPAGSPSKRKDGLKFYTANTVNIEISGWIHIHDAKGNQLRVIPASAVPVAATPAERVPNYLNRRTLF